MKVGVGASFPLLKRLIKSRRIAILRQWSASRNSHGRDGDIYAGWRNETNTASPRRVMSGYERHAGSESSLDFAPDLRGLHSRDGPTGA